VHWSGLANHLVTQSDPTRGWRAELERDLKENFLHHTLLPDTNPKRDLCFELETNQQPFTCQVKVLKTKPLEAHFHLVELKFNGKNANDQSFNLIEFH
uniref:Uncharacterized protein n=1 Tax=Amphilophus citrinellus TaxID=61819 RepID=A0A3Q0TFU4_AMPCI